MKPTHITLAADGRLQVDAPWHPEIVARIKALSGEWDKPRKVWYVAAIYADRLLEALPRASYSVDALDACWDAPRRRAANFATGLQRLGLRLGIDAQTGAVFVEGNVSPAIAEAVAEREDALREWLTQNPDGWQAAGYRRVEVDVSDADPLLGKIVTGMRNAAAAEERQREVRARVTRRRMLEQMELTLDAGK